VPGSSVDLAGIKEGDVVLEVGGKPIGDDPTALEPLETQADGTKVSVVFERGGMKRRVVVDLRRFLP
jgi:S1-C subfamily serine protease